MDQAELTHDPFDAYLREIYSRTPVKGRAGAFYSSDGDCAFVYTANVDHWRDRIDPLLTVYRAVTGDRIVGLQIKNLKRLQICELTARVTSADNKPHADVVELLLRSYSNQLQESLERQGATWDRAAAVAAYVEAFKALHDVPSKDLELVGSSR